MKYLAWLTKLIVFVAAMAMILKILGGAIQ